METKALIQGLGQVIKVFILFMSFIMIIQLALSIPISLFGNIPFVEVFRSWLGLLSFIISVFLTAMVLDKQI